MIFVIDGENNIRSYGIINGNRGKKIKKGDVVDFLRMGYIGVDENKMVEEIIGGVSLWNFYLLVDYYGD